MIIFTTSVFLQSQITLGTQLGMNYSNPKTVIVSEGKTEPDNILVGKPLFGYSAKVLGILPLNDKLTFYANIGFEKMRYESYSFGIGVLKINNLGLFLAQSYKIYKPVELFFAGEIVYRWNRSYSRFSALGKSIEGIHFQASSGLIYRNKKNYHMKLSFLIPNLHEVTAFLADLSFKRERVERLSVFRLEIGVPIINL